MRKLSVKKLNYVLSHPNKLSLNVAIFLFLSAMSLWSFAITAALLWLAPYQARYIFFCLVGIVILLFIAKKFGLFEKISKKLENY